MPDTQKPEPEPQPNVAVALLEALSRESESKEKREFTKDDSQWLYYQECHRGHPAFFYTANPTGRVIGPEGWYSKDKRADEPWRGIIPCQECSTRDESGFLVSEYPVQVIYQPSVKRMTHFIPESAYLYRMGKTAEIRAKFPRHRVSILNITAANVGVPNPDFPDSVKTIRRREMVAATVEVK